MVDASSIDNSLLISLVENKTVLWDKTTEFYKNRTATQEAWKEIMMALKPDFETLDEITRQNYVRLIMQRWTHIRDNYYRSYRKIQNQKRTGSKTTKPYLYSKKLKFLQKIMLPNETVSNVSIENIKSENQDNYSESFEDTNGIDTDVMVTIDATPGRMPARAMHNDTHSADQDPSTSNRHLLFFKGILPSLQSFDDNETLDFQMGVLKLVKKIKNSRHSNQFPTLIVKSEETSSLSGYSS